MDELIDKTPFHCIITALTNGGKTKYLIDKVYGLFRNVFEYIVSICPTYDKNKTYHNFAKGDRNVIVLITNCIEVFSGINTLIVLDDCVASEEAF